MKWQTKEICETVNGKHVPTGLTFECPVFEQDDQYFPAVRDLQQIISTQYPDLKPDFMLKALNQGIDLQLRLVVKPATGKKALRDKAMAWAAIHDKDGMMTALALGLKALEQYLDRIVKEQGF